MKTKFTLFSKWSLFLVAFVCFGQVNAQRNQVLSTKIATDSDDAEERGTNAASNSGLMDLGSSDIELVEDGSDGNQFVGLRFASVNLPKNAIIDSAFIQFTVDELNSNATSVTIKTEDVDSSFTFADTSFFNISNRPTSADSVNWDNIPAWNTVQEAELDQRTPDLADLIRTRITQSGWNQGNPITFLITGSGERSAEAYNANGSEAAELIVYYSVPTTTTFDILGGDDDAEEDLTNGSIDLGSSDLELVTENNDQAIGMRFDNISIPQGATIMSAYIQFQVDEVTTTGNVDVAFLVEDVTDASAYSTAITDISGRTYSAIDTILWNINGWATIGQTGTDQRSPDLSSLVQEIVNKAGWVSGNALAIGAVDPIYLGVAGYTGNTGKRTAESFNGSGGPELVIEYLEPNSFINGTFPIARGSSWKFEDSGNDLGTAWTANNYNDSTWDFGDAVLGYSNPNTTTLDFGTDANDKHITTYLRHTFNGDNTAQFDSLIFHVLRDDGVIVYINGTEAFRSNMPSGTVGFDTTASSAVGGADETTYYRFAVANTLTSGLNTIAVELHQANATSSDLSFDMEVEGKLPPLATTNYPIASGDEWNYLDNGVDLTSSNWKSLNYNDTTWAYGPSPLGYSNPSATELSFGPDPGNKYITYYFRKRINIANLSSLADSLVFNVKRDDGAVVYVNGTEVVRENMPAGTINYNTTSATVVGGADENTFFSTTLSKSVFNPGVNIIAVEVHQRDSSSSDLTFDMQILEKPSPRASCVGINDSHISCYTSVLPAAQGPDFIIPETHAFELLLEQGDAYTNTNVRSNAPGNNDFTGYVARNGSSVEGFVGVNHENTPGGVSIIDIHYVDSTRLWVVDSSEAVDFYNNDLVTTTRNCSGGITPWGTLISSEETTNSGDANADGYEDVGWQVEIDPVTKKVVEYGTPGKQEKLWAMGRMSHENIAVANDSLTAYEGEDRGSGCLYKFVADTKTDLSSGKLYALKLDSGLTGGEPNAPTGEWIPIPNTTQADRNTTNSLAISLGATPFNGIEDAEIGTIDGKIYFTSKGYNRVYSFSDDNDSTISQFKTFVGASTYLINYGSGVAAEPWASGNDNLCFDDLGNLYVLQDGSRDHVWMVGPNHTQSNPQVDIFARLPAGSEPCGMTFTPDYKFMFLSVQHPSGANASTFQVDAKGDTIYMDKSATLVIARKEFLGSYAPTLSSTNLVFNTAACDSLDISFNAGNGNGRIVVAKEASQVTEAPIDGSTYIANDTLGNGTDLGQGNFVIYDGMDSSMTLKGLEQNTQYHVSIFEYNTMPNKFYNLETPLIDSATTASVVTAAITGNVNVSASSTEPYDVVNTTGSSYDWIVSNGTINSGQGSNAISVTWASTMGSGEIQVVETNASGCIGDTVTLAINIGAVGLRSFDLDKAISIAPNPSNGRTTLRIDGTNEAFNIVVVDMLGKQVLRAQNVTNTYEIDLSAEGKGTYILRLETPNKVATKMLIVQ
ncbi:MAG: DUF839 domain-containing protein [Vicingaceae bacterium]